MGLRERDEAASMAKQLIAESGVSIAEWARANGFSSGLVYQVLEGKRKCVRGQSYRIAVALGIKDGNPLNVTELSLLLAKTIAPPEGDGGREEKAM